MLNPGWLQVGLWLRSKSEPENWFRVNKVVPDLIELQGPYPSNTPHLAKVEYLHSYYLSPTYFECDDCRRKPGSPTLCSDCLKRRTEFSKGGNHYCEFPRFCAIPFLKYGECGLPMECPPYVHPVRLSRYKRSWLI